MSFTPSNGEKVCASVKKQPDDQQHSIEQYGNSLLKNSRPEQIDPVSGGSATSLWVVIHRHMRSSSTHEPCNRINGGVI
jgi:hypothetical protein